MNRTLVVLAVTGGLAGCTFPPNASPPSTTIPATSPAVAVPPVAAAVATSTGGEAIDDSGLFAHGASPHADPPPATAPSPAVTAPSPTILLPVPPLPADVQPVRPSTPPSVLEPGEPDHAELTAGDLAAEWIAAVYTGRYDDPPNAAVDAVRPLAVNETLVAEALATIGPIDIAASEARWPYIAEITDAGDGWWQASVLVKSTRSGQVGPTSTPITVRVHVTDELLVDDWDEHR